MKRIILGDMDNVRDLGGYPAHGTYTKYMRFIRCDLPKGLTDSDYNFLISNGITTVIDLRNKWEKELKPNPFEHKEGFIYHSCPLFADGVLAQSAEEIPPAYIKIAITPDFIAPILHAAANAPEGVLFHCTAGKDRTGIVAAILLWIAGVEKPDIMADYIMTQAYLLEKYRTMLRNNPEFPFFLTKADLSYIEIFLDALWEKYPDSDEYLKAMGITDEEKASLKRKLLMD